MVPLCRLCRPVAQSERERDERRIEWMNEYRNVPTPHEAATLFVRQHTVIADGSHATRLRRCRHRIVCNSELSGLTTSYEAVAKTYGLDHSNAPALELVPVRGRSTIRIWVGLATLPLVAAVERSRSVPRDWTRRRVRLPLFRHVERWGKPITRDVLTHTVESRTGHRLWAFVNCFKRYAPIDRYR